MSDYIIFFRNPEMASLEISGELDLNKEIGLYIVENNDLSYKIERECVAYIVERRINA